jgi:hypothetical protein
MIEVRNGSKFCVEIMSNFVKRKDTMATKIPKLVYYSYNTNFNEWTLYMQKKPSTVLWHRNCVIVQNV